MEQALELPPLIPRFPPRQLPNIAEAGDGLVAEASSATPASLGIE
jgi:hypothetical protein